jgi:hypothetical protein
MCPNNTQSDSSQACQPCPATGCTSKYTFALTNVTFSGKRVIFKIVISSLTFLRQLKVSSKNFKIYIQRNGRRVLQGSATESSPDSVTMDDDGFLLGMDSPASLSAGSYSFAVKVVDVPSMVEAGQVSLSNAKSSAVFVVPADAVLSEASVGLRLFGFVVGPVLLLAGLFLKAKEFRYNPVLMSQLVFLMIFAVPELGMSYFYNGLGWSFTNLMFYNPFARLLTAYEESTSKLFSRVGVDHNIIRNGGSVMLSLAVLLPFMLAAALLFDRWRNRITRCTMALVQDALTPLLFFALSELLFASANQSLFTNGTFVASLALSCIFLLCCLLVPVLGCCIKGKDEL